MERILLLVVLGLLAYLVYLIFQPFLIPLAWAAIFTVMFYPVHRRVARRGSGANRAALVSTLLLAALIVTPRLLVFGARAGRRPSGGGPGCRRGGRSTGWPPTTSRPRTWPPSSARSCSSWPASWPGRWGGWRATWRGWGLIYSSRSSPLFISSGMGRWCWACCGASCPRKRGCARI